MKSIIFMLYDMHAGGVEKSLTSLFKEIDYEKYSVTLLLINRFGEYLEDVPQYVSIETIDMPIELQYELLYQNKIAFKKLLKEKHYVKACNQLIKILFCKILRIKRDIRFLIKKANKLLPIREKTYDLAIDFQGLGSGVFSTFFIAEKIKAKKKVTWIHQDISIFNEDFDWMNYYYEKFDKIFSVSRQAEKEFIKKFPRHIKKSDLFYNILPYKSINKLSNYKVDFRKKENEIIILSVGRLAYQKGYDVAFKVIKRLIEEKYRIKYIIIGEGERRQDLENLIIQYKLEDKVELLGFTNNPYPYMKLCDIYFQPSRFEGFCLTLGEAKLFSKPILTTDFAGASEQIINEKTGLICRFDEKQMYHNMKRLLDCPTLRDNLVSNLSGSIKDIEAPIEKLTELIE